MHLFPSPRVLPALPIYRLNNNQMILGSRKLQIFDGKKGVNAPRNGIGDIVLYYRRTSRIKRQGTPSFVMQE
jgi:hypothetical protein